MSVMSKPLLDLTAGDLMSTAVVRLTEEMPLREAAHLLRQADVSGAPVVDGDGRCIGVLSAADFLRWAEGDDLAAREVTVPACPFQVRGRLLTGQEAVICTLAEGGCPLQVARPVTGGRHTTLCTRPGAVPANRRQGEEDLPGDEVRRFMTPDPVTTPPITPIHTLARMMLDAHIHRVIVVDEERRPVGIVSSTDVLAALAHAGSKQQPSGKD